MMVPPEHGAPVPATQQNCPKRHPCVALGVQAASVTVK